MRPQDWPAQLDGYVGAARRTPFAWGAHDCVAWTCGWHALMTGRDVFAPFRGRYAGKPAALRLLAANGVEDICGAGRFLFGEPDKPAAALARGDIVAVEHPLLKIEALGLWSNGALCLLENEGLAAFKRDAVLLAWSV